MSGSAVCPYCRTAVEETEGNTLLCSGCGTPHHSDCFEENGGCTVFGCTAAPPAEPKLSIGATDLQAQQTAAPSLPPGVTARPAPPPPPRVSSGGGVVSSYSSQLFASTRYFTPDPSPPVVAVSVPQAVTSPLSVGLVSSRERTTFQLLGALLGAFGAHSFYAGFRTKGFVQLFITLLTFGFGGLMVWIWAVIDICTITTDYEGLPFKS